MEYNHVSCIGTKHQKTRTCSVSSRTVESSTAYAYVFGLVRVDCIGNYRYYILKV